MWETKEEEEKKSIKDFDAVDGWEESAHEGHPSP